MRNIHEETVAAKDEEITQLNAEIIDLKNSLAELETVKAELDAYKRKEKEEKFTRLLKALPVGMTNTEEQRTQLMEMLENRPVDLLFTVIDSMKPVEGTTKRTGTPYTFTDTGTPLTTVGNLSGRP